MTRSGFQTPEVLSGTETIGELHRAHLEMRDVFETRYSVAAHENAQKVVEDFNVFNLLVDVKHCMFSVGESSELYFSLYDSKKKKFISYVFFFSFFFFLLALDLS